MGVVDGVDGGAGGAGGVGVAAGCNGQHGGLVVVLVGFVSRRQVAERIRLAPALGR